jgi:hypothetical protein
MQLPFRVLLYRYVFFTWLFKDLRAQSNLFERAAALRYNREQAHWLPLYMRRYAFAGCGLFALGWAVQALSPVLSAFFFVPGTLAVPMLAVTAVCWTALRTPD